MMEHSHVLTLTLHNFLKWFHPPSKNIDGLMAFNFCICCKLFKEKLTVAESNPESNLIGTLQGSGLDTIPDNWISDKQLCDVFMATINEVLIWNPDEWHRSIWVIQIMEWVKASQSSGYAYCFYYGPDSYPNRILQMTLEQIRIYQIFGGGVPLNIQKKRKYHFHWVFSCPTESIGTKTWFTSVIRLHSRMTGLCLFYTPCLKFLSIH